MVRVQLAFGVKAPLVVAVVVVMAVDPIRKVLVVYGGRGPSDQWLEDTWIWDGSRWAAQNAANHPTLIFAMGAFDLAIGKVVILGLKPDLSSMETWTWDGSWQRIETA